MKNWHQVAGYIFLVVLLLILYLPVFPTDFFSIDDSQLTQIELIQNPPSWKNFLNFFNPGKGLDFYPVRDLSYWIDAHVFDNTPFSYRAHNFFWFIVLVLSLASILQNLGVGKLATLSCVSLWALHPYHTEMVSWISVRKDLLALAFGAVSFLAFQKNRHWLCAVFFLLSIGSKASLVLMPLVGLFAIFTGNVPRTRKNTLLFSGLSIMGLGSALFQKYFYTNYTDMSIDWPWQIRTHGVLIALGKYFVGFFDFNQIVLDIEFWGDWFELNSNYLGFGLGVVGCFFGLLVSFRKSKEHLVWSAALVLAYLPVSALIFPHRIFYASRYLEAPLFVFFIGLGVWGTRKLPKSVVWSTWIFFALLFGYGTFKRVHLWAEPVEFWESAVNAFPQSIPLKGQLLTQIENQKSSRQGVPEEFAELSQLSTSLIGDLFESCPLEKKASYEENCVGFFYLMSNIYFRAKDSKKTRELFDRTQNAIQNSPNPVRVTFENLYEKINFYKTLFNWEPKKRPIRLEKLKSYKDLYPLAKCFLGATSEKMNQESRILGKNLIGSSWIPEPNSLKVHDCTSK